MRSKQKVVGLVLFGVAVVVAATLFLRGHNVAVLNPAGTIASKERQLIIIALLLSLIVVVPVFIMLFGFAWKYNERNKKPGVYTPDNGGSRLLETIWWLVPTALLAVLSVIIWRSSHELDPSRAIASTTKPVTIQVVALDWKWLFIYPEEHVATVNLLELPVDTPVNFQLTADAPMNSLWIPQLGGQVYAMTGMSTQLHLMASKTGVYRGSSANISGKGFAGMKFSVPVTSMANYETWLSHIREDAPTLDQMSYNKLAKPSENNAATVYNLADTSLYDTIVMKYMMPTNTQTEDISNMTGMTQ